MSKLTELILSYTPFIKGNKIAGKCLIKDVIFQKYSDVIQITVIIDNINNNLQQIKDTINNILNFGFTVVNGKYGTIICKYRLLEENSFNVEKDNLSVIIFLEYNRIM